MEVMKVMKVMGPAQEGPSTSSGRTERARDQAPTFRTASCLPTSITSITFITRITTRPVPALKSAPR